MKVTLIEEPNKECHSALLQILHNRGVEDLYGYLNSTMEDINDPAAFGEEVMRQGAKMLIGHIAAEDDIMVVVDADCDGFTSAALFINYLYEIFPAFVQKHLYYYLHDSKQHGLSDCINKALEYKLVICPDSGRCKNCL